MLPHIYTPDLRAQRERYFLLGPSTSCIRAALRLTLGLVDHLAKMCLTTRENNMLVFLIILLFIFFLNGAQLKYLILAQKNLLFSNQEGVSFSSQRFVLCSQWD